MAAISVRQGNCETWKDVRDWIRARRPGAADPEPKERRELLILGPGGVGKTTLANFLTGEFSHVETRADRYVESIFPEEFRLREPPTALIVAPGQKRRREIFWPDIESGLASRRYFGVILVMSYGYHSIGEVSLSTLIGRPGGDASRNRKRVAEWLEDHLKRCRDDENDILKRVLPFLVRSPRKCWLLTVVTKQDLWFDRDSAVRSHSLHGAYGEVVRQLFDQRGQKQPQEVAFTCLMLQNFQTAHKELLQNTIAGYDQSRYNAAVRELLAKLAALRA